MKLTLTAKIDKNGDLLINGKSLMREFTMQNKGKKALLNLELLPKNPSQAMIGYYEGVILPEMVRGFREKGMYYTQQKVDELLKSSFVPMNKETANKGIFITEVKEYSETHKQDMLEYLDFCRIYAANNLQTHIAEPRTLFE